MRVNGQFVVPQLTVESEVDGVALPKANGVPDDRTGFFKTKIVNLNTFRLVRLTIEFGQYRWVIDKPTQHLVLEGAAMVSENTKEEPRLTSGLPEFSDPPTVGP